MARIIIALALLVTYPVVAGASSPSDNAFALMTLSTSRSASARIEVGSVLSVISFPPDARSTHTVAVQARASIPNTLTILGRDERLAFHDTEVILYLAITPRNNTQLVRDATVTLRVPGRYAQKPYYMSYRGPDSDSWVMPGVVGIARGAGHFLTVAFDARNLPISLRANETYSLVLYSPSNPTAA